jgi:hypothetical protein
MNNTISRNLPKVVGTIDSQRASGHVGNGFNEHSGLLMSNMHSQNLRKNSGQCVHSNLKGILRSMLN